MRAVVTGSTNGVGEAIARRLASEGLTVILVGRSDERLRAARERITAAVPGADLVLERADLAELAQVRDLAERLLAGPLPDTVISNAALVAPHRYTPYGETNAEFSERAVASVRQDPADARLGRVRAEAGVHERRERS